MPQKGDLNHDGWIAAADAIIALQMVASGGHSDDAIMILQAAGGGDMIAMWGCSRDENMTT